MIKQSCLKESATALLILLLFASGLPAQDAFEAIPKAIAPRYHFDLARYFFADPTSERRARTSLFETVGKFEKLKGKVTASAENLLDAMELSDQVQSASYRHSMYLYLRYAIDTKDERSLNDSTQLSADIGKRTSFLQQELMVLSDKQLMVFLRQKPELKKFSFVIESARRYAPHTLTLKEEELIRELSPLTRDWTGELFQRARDRTQFGTVKSAGGLLDVYRQEQEIDNSTDRRVREEGFKKKYAGYASHRDIYAFSLSRLIRAANQLSRLHRFKDSAEENHFGMYFGSDEVRALYEKIALEAEVNKRFERDRVARVKKITGYQDINIWDMSVVAPQLKRPRFDITETSKILQRSLAVFGTEYSKELSELLDPANGRLDIVGGENRVQGAFAAGNAGRETSIFYSFNYEGYFDDLDALAHEAGHAVHFRLMGNNRVSPSYVYGAPYFTEAFAMFNELVVINDLYQNEPDRQKKIFFLEQFLFYALFLYRNTMTATMEQAIYDASSDGKMLTADDMDSISKKVGARFSIWYEKNDELKMRWINIHHFYDVPMYYPNYVYAALLALKFYEMYTKDRQRFIPNYLSLLRNGIGDRPTLLLKKFLNLDLNDPKLVSDTTTVLNKKLDELESLYAN